MPRDNAAIKERIYTCTSQQEAIDYLTSLKLTIKEIKDLSKYCNAYLMNQTKKENMIRSLVLTTVVAKLNYEAIHRI